MTLALAIWVCACQAFLSAEPIGSGPDSADGAAGADANGVADAAVEPDADAALPSDADAALPSDADAALQGDAPTDVSTDAAPPFSTQGLVVWLAADRGVEGPAGAISAWRDQSGASNDAVQSNASMAPSLEPMDGGLPMLLMSGGGLGGGRALNLPGRDATAFEDFGAGITIFAVVRPVGGNFHTILALAGEAQNIELFHGASNELCLNLAGVLTCSDDNAFAGGATRLYGAVVGASGDGGTVSVTLYEKGTFVASGSGPKPLVEVRQRSAVGGSVLINGSFFETLRGYFGELLIFRRALSDGERAEVERYLKPRWGL